MFFKKLLTTSKKLRPFIIDQAEKSVMKKTPHSSRAKLIFPSIVIGTIIYENYEKLFSMFGLSQSRLKKRIDSWNGIEELEKTVDLNVTDLVI